MEFADALVLVLPSISVPPNDWLATVMLLDRVLPAVPSSVAEFAETALEFPSVIALPFPANGETAPRAAESHRAALDRHAAREIRRRSAQGDLTRGNVVAGVDEGDIPIAVKRRPGTRTEGD
ncbi:MAG: hypothetical protein QM760_15090 [Nibricoccus sp.]